MGNKSSDGLRRGAVESTAAVAAELALGGGPIGVIAAGAAPLAVRASGRLAAAIQRRWEDKAERALQTAAAILDVGVDIFDERLPGHDERVELLARVIEAAARSTLEEKVTALGRVLAQGLRDDGDTDEALILAAALGALEGPHVLLLEHLRGQPIPPSSFLRPGVTSLPGWQAEDLAQALPDLAEVMDGLVAVLGGHGLIASAGSVNYPSFVGPSIWKITPLGRRCLFLLDVQEPQLESG